MNNPKTEEIVEFTREYANTLRFEDPTAMVWLGHAADLIEQLQQELIDERYRHDRLQDFCVAQGEELSKLKERQKANEHKERNIELCGTGCITEASLKILLPPKALKLSGIGRDQRVFIVAGKGCIALLAHNDGLYRNAKRYDLGKDVKWEELKDKDIEPEFAQRVTHKPDAQLRPLRDMDEIKYYMGDEPKEE